MKNIYFVTSYTDYQKTLKRAIQNNHPLSEPKIEFEIYKDSDLIMLDMMIEDHTRRTNQFDGVMGITFMDITYPTNEYLEYFCSFINYYATSATVVLKANHNVIQKMMDSDLLHYECHYEMKKEGEKE